MHTECTIWAGAVQNNGYGQIRREGKLYLAHRWAYSQHHGIPMSDLPKVVRHACDNRLCVNPAHLEAGTQVENMQDRKDRADKFHALSRADVVNIKAALHAGQSGASLAREYSVTPTMISYIKRGKQWACVPWPAG